MYTQVIYKVGVHIVIRDHKKVFSSKVCCHLSKSVRAGHVELQLLSHIIPTREYELQKASRERGEKIKAGKSLDETLPKDCKAK